MTEFSFCDLFANALSFGRGVFNIQSWVVLGFMAQTPSLIYLHFT